MWSNKDMYCGKIWMQRECQIWDVILSKLLVCLDYWWVLELEEISRGNKKDSFKVSVLGERNTGNTLTDSKKEEWTEVTDTLHFCGWQHISLIMISGALKIWVWSLNKGQ